MKSNGKLLIIISGLALLLNLLLNFLFSIFFGKETRFYTNFGEPVFYIIITFFLVRKWKTSGFIASMAIFAIPYVLLFLASLFEYGLDRSFYIFSKPIIYEVQLDSLFGIMLGLLLEFVVKQIRHE